MGLRAEARTGLDTEDRPSWAALGKARQKMTKRKSTPFGGLRMARPVLEERKGEMRVREPLLEHSTGMVVGFGLGPCSFPPRVCSGHSLRVGG